MNDFFTYLLYSTCWRLIRLLPEKSAYSLAAQLGGYFARRGGKQVTRLRDNLRRVLPDLSSSELDAVTTEGMKSYLRYWFDTFRFSDWDVAKIRQGVEVINGDAFYGPLRAGKGLIVSLPHAGNWDHAGAYFCAEGFHLVTVVEHLKPEKLFQKFLEHRKRMGMEALDLNSRVMATLAQRLREGKLVALVSDRDLSQSGLEVRFFNGISKMPAGPAALAIQTGAPLIVAYTSYTRDGLKIEFSNALEIPTGERTEQIQKMTQKCADIFAEKIRNSPTDWHMLQRVWIDDLAGSAQR